jgi:hypothetical protein
VDSGCTVDTSTRSGPRSHRYLRRQSLHLRQSQSRQTIQHAPPQRKSGMTTKTKQLLTLVLTAALAVGAAGGATPQTSKGSTSSEPREVRRTGRPLKELVKNADRQLRVKGGAEPPLRMEPAAGETKIELLLRLKMAAVSGTVLSVTPHLTSPRRWIGLSLM